MAIPAQLQVDLAELRVAGYTIEVVEDGTRYYVIFRDFRLPDSKFLASTTDLMLMTDYLYPQSAMDMFWTDPAVRCPGGTLPQGANNFETYGGRTWQRWSWHYSGWNPAHHNVRTHLEVVRDRLARGH